MNEARAELIRIDTHGQAHPIGKVASQRMRARTGAYRMLPAPPHVVFMRYTGEDGRRDAEDGAIVRLAGELTTPGAMCDVLALLAQSGWRGELVVLEGITSRSVFLEHQLVVGVSTTADDERLGMVLYRFGAISREQHQLVAEQAQAGRRIGEVCVEQGMLTQEQLYEYIRKQVEEVVFATLTVSDGTFFFLDGFDESRLVSRHAISASGLLMEGVTRLDEMRYFRAKIPSAEYVPVRAKGGGEPPADAAALYGLIDGLRDIEELGRLSGKGEFETTKQVYQLVQSKHVRMTPPRPSGGPAAIVVTANAALHTIFEMVDAADKGAGVRRNLASFAVGAGVYDILFRGAGPDRDGTLDPEPVAKNVSVVACGAAPENILRQMLREYVSFALFSAGAALGAQREAELSRKVSPMLAQLRPEA